MVAPSTNLARVQFGKIHRELSFGCCGALLSTEGKGAKRERERERERESKAMNIITFVLPPRRGKVELMERGCTQDTDVRISPRCLPMLACLLPQ